MPTGPASSGGSAPSTAASSTPGWRCTSSRSRPRSSRRGCADQARPAPQPSTAFLERGQQIFLGSACEYCHTIAGTNAIGHDRARPDAHREPPLDRRGDAPEQRRRPRRLDPRPAALQAGQQDAGDRAHRRGASAPARLPREPALIAEAPLAAARALLGRARGLRRRARRPSTTSESASATSSRQASSSRSAASRRSSCASSSRGRTNRFSRRSSTTSCSRCTGSR